MSKKNNLTKWGWGGGGGKAGRGQGKGERANWAGRGVRSGEWGVRKGGGRDGGKIVPWTLLFATDYHCLLVAITINCPKHFFKLSTHCLSSLLFYFTIFLSFLFFPSPTAAPGSSRQCLSKRSTRLSRGPLFLFPFLCLFIYSFIHLFIQNNLVMPFSFFFQSTYLFLQFHHTSNRCSQRHMDPAGAIKDTHRSLLGP